MSTDYRFDRDVTRKEFEDAVRTTGLKINVNKDSTNDSVCVTDDNCYIWFYMFKDVVSSMSRYGRNYAGEDSIIHVLAEELQCGYLSEYDDDYWEDEEDDGGAA